MRSPARRPGSGSIVTVALAAAFLLLAAVAAYGYFAYRRALSDLIVERDRQLAFLSAFRLRDELAKLAEPLEAASGTADLRSANRATQRDALRRIAGSMAVFDGGLIVLDDHGRVVATEPERPALLNDDWSNRKFFQDLIDQRTTVFSNAVQDGRGGPWIVLAAAPIMTEHGEVRGALLGLFKLGEPTASAFYAGIVRLRLGQSGNTYVVDGSGRILFDSGSSGVLSHISSSGLPPETWSGGAGAMQVRDAVGTDIVTAFAPVPGTDWMLITEDDWILATAPVRRSARTLLAMIVIASVIPAAAVWYSVRANRSRERSLTEERISQMVHRSLLPEAPPLLGGWSLAVLHLNAETLGGDFFDFFVLPDTRLMCVVGTVEGGGVQGTMILASTRTALRGSALQGILPAEALECSNELLCPDVGDSVHVACTLLSLDPASGAVHTASAGGVLPLFNPAYLDLAGLQSGPPLGSQFDAKFPSLEGLIRPGEMVVLVSQGLLGLQAADGRAFAGEFLEAWLRSSWPSAGAAVEALEAALAEARSRNPSPAQLDLTAVVIHRNPSQSISKATSP